MTNDLERYLWRAHGALNWCVGRHRSTQIMTPSERAREISAKTTFQVERRSIGATLAAAIQNACNKYLLSARCKACHSSCASQWEKHEKTLVVSERNANVVRQSASLNENKKIKLI